VGPSAPGFAADATSLGGAPIAVAQRKIESQYQFWCNLLADRLSATVPELRRAGIGLRGQLQIRAWHGAFKISFIQWNYAGVVRAL
jgi:hypothetical protein